MQIIFKTLVYLRDRQIPAVMYLHFALIFLIISQLILSNFMKFNDSGEISNNVVEFYGTWTHIISGIFIAPVTLIFIFLVIKTRSVKNFFPYLSGNYSQLLDDFLQLKQLKLPEPTSYGLASIVQGLGLSALLFVLISGITWFIFWKNGLPGSDMLKETHKLLTGLVIGYIIGHGGMGIIHIIKHYKNAK